MSAPSGPSPGYDDTGSGSSSAGSPNTGMSAGWYDGLSVYVLSNGLNSHDYFV